MATESTASEIPGILSSVEEGNKFNLDNHLVKLLLHEPFFSEILRRVTKVRTDNIPTAGVTVKDLDITMLWNPRFLAALSTRHVIGVMKHECYHLIFDHCVTRKQEPHMIWNWATDLAINSILDEDELPEFGLRPGKPLDLSHIEDKEKAKKWQKVSELIESLPPKMASEWYMKKLMSDKDISNTIENEPGDGIGVTDDHEGWGDMTEEEKEIVKGKVRQSLRDAVKKADRSGQWGSVSSDVREKLRKIASDTIDWKKVLQSFVGRSQRMNKSRTHKKINRKYPYIHPGTRRSHSSNLAIYFDQSGSVSNEDCEIFFGALSELSKLTTFHVFPFDTSVDEENGFTWRRGQKIDPQRTSCGGTSFSVVQNHFNENLDEYDGYICLTDGEASDPGPSRKRRCWVLLPGHRLYFDPHPNDIVVNMQKS